MNKGCLITFEGLDGSGKSTMAYKTFKYLAENMVQCALESEPTSKFKELIVNDTKLTAEAEAFLFLADRIQHIEETIKPYLQQGLVVIIDRYMDSTYAYQCFAGMNKYTSIVETVNKDASITPDLTFYLDIPVEVSNNRARVKNKFEYKPDIYKRNVKNGYDFLAKKENRFITIDATKPEEEVWNIIKQHLDEVIAKVKHK